jgi:hypothetical protein
MAKRKRTRQAQGAPPTQHAPDTANRIVVPESSASNPPESRTRIGKGLTRFTDWAIKKALDFLLLGVIFFMTAPTIAIWLYIKSGKAAWTYPWLYAALGFIAACLVIISASSLLAFVRAQRRRAAERAANVEFLSQDRGYLDHAVNQAKAFKTFNSLVGGMAEVMAKITKTGQRATTYMRLAQSTFTPYPNVLALVGQRIAARTAKKLNNHATEMQSYLTKVEATSNLLIESITGYTTWFPVNTTEQAQVLITNKVALEKMLTILRASVGSTQGFRDSQQGLYGISQRLNTAVNRMVSVTDGVLSFLRESVDQWDQVVELMNDKLSNANVPK